MLSLLLLPDLGLKRWFGIPLSVHSQKITADVFAVPLGVSSRNKDDRRWSRLFYVKIVNVTERKLNPSKCNVALLNFRSSEITFPNGLKSIILRPPLLRSPIIVFLVYFLLFCCSRKKYDAVYLITEVFRNWQCGCIANFSERSSKRFVYSGFSRKNCCIIRTL